MDAMQVELETARKIFYLLKHDYVFLASYNEEKSDWDGGAYPCINCGDLFVPGADAEALKAEELDCFIEVMQRFPLAGAAAWCAVKRSANLWRKYSRDAWLTEYEAALKEIPEVMSKYEALRTAQEEVFCALMVRGVWKMSKED